jgi:hypothetical protein
MEGTRDTVARGLSDNRGEVIFRNVPVGSYRVVAEPGLLGDSLFLSHLSVSLLQVAASQEPAFTLGVSFPVKTIPQIASGPENTRVFVEGIALGRPGTPPTAVLHVWDGTRAIRTVDIALSATPGDSVRVLGRTRRVLGQMVMEGSIGRITREGTVSPLPLPVSTADAATARAGNLDAALVRVRDATVSDTATAFGRLTLQASDGSGIVSIQFPAGFLVEAEIVALTPGMVVSITGLLVPETTNRWRLHPRTGQDLTLVGPTPQEVSVGPP